MDTETLCWDRVLMENRGFVGGRVAIHEFDRIINGVIQAMNATEKKIIFILRDVSQVPKLKGSRVTGKEVACGIRRKIVLRNKTVLSDIGDGTFRFSEEGEATNFVVIQARQE